MDNSEAMEQQMISERMRRKLDEVNVAAQTQLAPIQDHINFTLQQQYFKCAYECFDRRKKQEEISNCVEHCRVPVLNAQQHFENTMAKFQVDYHDIENISMYRFAAFYEVEAEQRPHSVSFYFPIQKMKNVKKKAHRTFELWDGEPWSFEHHVGEAVFIPAGCPFQLRNLQSTVQLGLDFLFPESVGEASRLAKEIHCLPNDHEAKLQICGGEVWIRYAACSGGCLCQKGLIYSVTRGRLVRENGLEWNGFKK